MEESRGLSLHVLYLHIMGVYIIFKYHNNYTMFIHVQLCTAHNHCILGFPISSHFPPSPQDRQVGTDHLEEMGRLFCVGLLKLVEEPSPIIPDSTQHQLPVGMLGRTGKKKNSSSHRSEDSEDSSEREKEEEEEEEEEEGSSERFVASAVSSLQVLTTNGIFLSHSGSNDDEEEEEGEKEEEKKKEEKKEEKVEKEEEREKRVMDRSELTKETY